MRNFKKLIKEKKKVFLLTIVIAIVVGIIGPSIKNSTTEKEIIEERQQTTSVSPTILPLRTKSSSPVRTVIKPTLTEAIIIPGWKKYTDPEGNYSFEIPADWDISIIKYDGKLGIVGVKATFLADNQQYNFIISYAYGRGIPDGWTATTEERMIGNIPVKVHTWYKSGNPVNISIGDFPLKGAGMEIDLPPVNTNHYISTFHHILSTFQFN